MPERIFVVPPIEIAMGTRRRSLSERLWAWLGFGAKHNPGFDDVGNRGNPDWAPGELSSDIYLHFDLADRLRVLFGGPVAVALRTRTDVIVTRCESKSVVGVMWPGYRDPRHVLRAHDTTPARDESGSAQ